MNSVKKVSLMHDDFSNKVTESIIRLLDYCKKNDWAGYDPFDGLNSKIFALIPFHKNKLPRLFFIQFMKRFPVNLRHVLLVPKEQNPKGLALFASALIRLSEVGLLDNSDIIHSVLKKLIESRTQNSKFYCWGYNFDWQNRRFFLPKFSPNIICTTFAANALLDFYEKSKKPEHLDMAVSAGHFLLSGLNTTRDDSGICFSYTPFDYGQVHNTNLLGAAFLARLYSITGEKSFLDFALQAVKFSVSRQSADGSWPYGEHKSQRWVDNFHTGYNLVALKKFSKYTGNQDFLDIIKKGYQFYKDNFFINNCIPKYYHNRVYPIDIHSISQSIITPIEMMAIDKDAIQLSKSVCIWAIKNMQSKTGYFFYQKKRYYKNRIPYMRWSQAWMLYALSILAQALYSEGFISSR